METLLVLAVVSALAVAAFFALLRRLICICQPNQVLILSGTHRTVGTRTIGYRLVQGGRAFRIPLLERVDMLDLTNMVIDISVEGAYSKGGIALNVEGVANVKIASEEPTIGNAIERFLGQPRAALVKVAKETLEGNLRGVLATLTPEELNHDRIKFAQSLLQEADHDLKRLGLVLDTLKIQTVSDDSGYLNSLGRKQSAELQMRSRIAEAENKALAAERGAKNFEEKEIRRIEAEFAIAQADVERRLVDAQTRKAALVSEERSQVTAEVAKAQAAVAVQKARIEQVRLQLLADGIRPAEAHQQKLVAEARGAAARIVEDGKATAESLKELARTWQAAGDAARQIFVAQKLDRLVELMMSTVAGTKTDKVTFIDARLNEAGGNIATKVALAAEQLKHSLGIDVGALLSQAASKGDGKAPAKSAG